MLSSPCARTRIVANHRPPFSAFYIVLCRQGVENYSRHLAGRGPGDPPETLVDYFPSDDWLLIVDESHVSAPQLGAMWGGDRARKSKLVEHGFRLPSALDNRPLKVRVYALVRVGPRDRTEDIR